ncbi:DNA-binding protein [Allosaccharopolyspora coralli]|uniref:DNA-binding protein n=1 Tax=Allosaccharopolyspora coralli TaxID=2665642 RepID=A0A5Q3QCN2_9PSEU|nr:helicase-associated domain-containing protein [Allosaccharopolyspora coralli]QGK68557.1 DNA-binding protein [Allosaccharopolyspora coralli]
MPNASLTEWLRDRGDEELVELLRARPDLAAPPPADSSVLATRAGVRSSVARACEELDAFALSTLEALVVLDADQEPTSLEALAELLGSEVTPQRVRRTVQLLRAHALVWGDDDGLAVPTTLREAVPSTPGGLGRPSSLARAEAEEAVAALDDGERALVDKLADGSPLGRTRDAALERPRADSDSPAERLLARSLLLRRDKQTVELPREMAFAVRGDCPMGTVQPEEPILDLVEREQHTVDSTSAGAVLELLRHMESLLDAWGDDPPDVLRSGGVGVRELRRTAKDVDVDEDRLALLVELAVAAGLLARTDDEAPQWVPTTQSDTWRSSMPEQQWAVVAKTWLDLPRLPGLIGARDEKDKPLGPLSEQLRRPNAPRDRRRVLTLLDELPSGHGIRDAADVAAVLAWRAPRRGGRLRDDLVRWSVAEATAIGVVALGALPTAGRALLDGSSEAAKLLGESLPEPLDHVLVQADLTVVAPGRLEPDLAAEMHQIADVESAGSATVFRVSESSVRRAYDAGRSADDLHAFFRERSRTPVPQALTYLIDDVSRRHGRLRAGTASAFLRCDDEVLLAEVLASAALADLELRKIAPTVLVSPLPLSEVVDTMRSAGFAPVAEGPDGQVLDLTAKGPRVRAMGREPAPAALPTPSEDKLAELVRQVRAGDRASTARRGSAVTPERGRPSASATLELLRDAATHERSVWLGFVDAHGGATQRVVAPVTVGGGILQGYDQGSGELGNFPLHRITSVAVVDE